MVIRQICGPLNCNSVNSEKDEYLQFLLLANEVWSKVLFLHLCVILFTGGGGSVPPMQTPCPWMQTPRMETLPPGCRPPPPPGYVNNRAVCILLECILVVSDVPVAVPNHALTSETSQHNRFGT